MPLVLQLRVHEKDLDMNPEVWYLYPCHDKETFSEKNKISVRARKSLVSHWSDLNYEENCEKIKQDIGKVLSVLAAHSLVVLPLEEITNYIGEMEEHCPKTKEFLDKQIERLVKYDHQTKRPV